MLWQKNRKIEFFGKLTPVKKLLPDKQIFDMILLARDRTNPGPYSI